jgi:small subunit ribosomal protein S16
MATRIRLKRIGRTNRPSFRICVFDGRTRRDGPPIEELGSYDPRAKSFAEKVKLNAERATYWLGVGAQPSETVNSFFRKLGVRKPVKAKPAGGETAAKGA